jgi:hypothetical protein
VLLAFSGASSARGDEPAGDGAPLEPIAEFSAMAEPLMAQYCGDCHTGDYAESGFDYQELRGGDDFQVDRATWKDVLRRLRAGDMPPADMDQPTDDERQQLVDWIATKLDMVDCSGDVDPGRVTLRRLNREQYENTIRDLLGVRYDSNELFPPDELAYGFDNNGDVLTISPLLFEKYLKAAASIAAQAVPAAEEFAGRGTRVDLGLTSGSDDYGDGARMLFTQTTVRGDFKPSARGRYAVRATVAGMQAGDDPVRMRIWLGDRVLKQFDVWSELDEPEMFVALFDADAGQTVSLGVEFANDFYDEQAAGNNDRNLVVEKVQVVGPLRLADDAPPIAGRLLLAKEPSPEDWHSDNNLWQALARDRLRAWVPRAYRQHVDEEEIDRLIDLMAKSRAAGDSYHRALQLAVQAVLVSPRFLLIGDVTAKAQESGIRRIDDFALASRLSYFLWGTMPDDELLAIADRGALHDQLDKQVARMVRDARVRHLSTSFAGQWLETRQLATFQPDPATFPDFDDELRSAMQRETEKLFEAMMIDDRPITMLLDSDVTYLNERLARHYGIEGVTGNYFREVKLSPEQRAVGRGGVLGLASILTVTSNPDRTSPVMRGKFVLANLLGDEPPPPPPNVPSLAAASDEAAGDSIREQLERHRADPGCAACHKQMDPLGFALEKFDALGRIRSDDSGQPIDDTAELPDGTKLAGVNGVRELLVAHTDQFRHVMAEKMLTFALGRGLEYYDECALREIIAATQAADDRFSALVKSIVRSRPFLLESDDSAIDETKSSADSNTKDLP